jgi:predicted RNase H-like nuclease
MQPTSKSKTERFGEGAPVWGFIDTFGGAGDPLASPSADAVVYETYPVLTIISQGWSLKDSRPKGRIPKYNPEKRKAIWDWLEVCENTSAAFLERGLGESEIFRWIKDVGTEEKPKKSDQDKLDACLCLVVALDLAERKDCLMVGEMESGYMVVPYIDEVLQKELEERCVATGRKRSEWVHKFKLSAS